MDIKIRDKFKLADGSIATVININDFREPRMKYAVVIDSTEDHTYFCGNDALMGLERILD